ncbi:twin-arginine translocase subunit TatC [Haloarchaeobius sp. TZWSO28]|uniref:twin-arginine translocase subunit TatC n=1 Tax=Haloarchaeobius sp. TZWSO28 TaxID=3446119 RepID=UPI003EBDC31C
MSSVVGEDTARTINQGRESLGVLLRTAQKHLQKVFIVFLIGLLGTIYALRLFIWDFLRANTQQRMSANVAEQVDVIARTPFDVILLQVKIGLVVGILFALPVLLYYARDSLAQRGFRPKVPLSRFQIVGFISLGVFLFTLGVIYAYAVFFPFMFQFLATNAVNASIKPSYDITMWTQFIVLLTFSFGLAAQLPLAMSALSYTEIIPYEQWRDKWRYAFVAIFVFGAVFSPPDPFTQIMWALPLVSLYVLSLGFSKVVTNLHRAGENSPSGGSNLLRTRIYQLLGIVGLTAVASYFAVDAGGLETVNRQVISQFPEWVPIGPLSVEGLTPFTGIAGQILVAIEAGLIVGTFILVAYTVVVLRQPTVPRGGRRTGDPASIDLDTLDAAGVRAAPIEAFMELSEDKALKHARTAMDEDDSEKAQALLDRFDEAQEVKEMQEAAEAGDQPKSLADPSSMGGDVAPEDAEGESNVLSRTAAGVLNPFTEEETTEDDIGGYYYDLAFILQSLTSKFFRLIALFMIVLVGSFGWLYGGGLGEIKRNFISRVPPAIRGDPAAVGFEEFFVAGQPLTDAMTVMPGVPEAATVGPTNPGAVVGAHPYEQIVSALGGPSEVGLIVALHPVEALIFEVKVSTLLAVVTTLPLLLYYAWPAMKERGIVKTGNNNMFLIWGVALFVGFIIGSVLGFFVVAPTIISYLVSDAIQADIIISYRLQSFFWLIFFTTAGIGIFIDIPVTMLLFHRGRIVRYEAFREYWRPIILGIFALAAVFTPSGVLTMLILAIPISLAYGIGLVLLGLVTFPWRLRGGGGGSKPEEPEPESV